jgi:mediator of replication checkpoint protein 1
MKHRLASRSQSPTSPLGSTGAELSPWSKIRAEVLGPRIDTKDDDASTLAKHGEEGSDDGTDELDRPQGKVSRKLNDRYGLSESDEAPRRPVGRMVARLVGSESDTEAPENDRDAYARVKSLLLGRKDQGPEEQLGGSESTTAKTVTSSLDSPDLAPSLQAHSSPQRSPSRRSRNSSPGLFVSPDKHSIPSLVQHNKSADSASESDELPADLMRNARFNELVAKKRAERRAREHVAKEKAEEARRCAAAKLTIEVEQFGKILSAEADSDDDRRVRNRLTQQSRPARKASKKALEDMSRETQRLARNQQLTHQTMVKKKFTTKDLFRRFGYKQDDSMQGQSTSRTDDEFVMSGALISSDAEARRAKDTPPSSPPSITGSVEKHMNTPGAIHHNGDGESYDDTERDLPTLEEIMSQPIVKVDNGKAPLRPGADHHSINSHQKLISSRQGRWRRSLKVAAISNPADDSNDEIEIVGKPRIAVFDKLPAKKRQEPHSLINLRALAHLTSPSKVQSKGRKSLTSCELQLQLQQRARKQALLEKQERIADLQAKGIIIQTEEERQKEQLELENLLEKARHEAMELAKREKEAAKKEGKSLPEDFEDSDDEEDGEYEESDVEEEEDDVKFSGSEEEEEGVDGDDEGGNDGDEEEENDEMTTDDTNLLVNNSTEEGQEDPGARQENGFVEQEEQLDASKHQASNVRSRKVILDEDDDEPDKRTPVKKDVLQPPKSSAMAAFGFPTPGAGDLGLTQIFAGTMADLDTQTEDNQPTVQGQDIMNLMQQFPTSLLPEPDSISTISPDILVQDSQSNTAVKSHDHNLQQPIGFRFSQLPAQEQSITSPTKLSEIPEPTQDAGFEKPHSVHPTLPELHSTIETVVLPFEDHPVVRKRGRLHRRTEASATLSDHDDETLQTDTDIRPENDFHLSTNAFDVLFKATKKTGPVDDFDKKKSEAKKMVEEQAEESEDEYAGLGGASDEESDGEVDEEVAKMIDESHVEVNESKLAQLYA